MPSPEHYQYTPPGVLCSEQERQPATQLVESLNRLEQAVDAMHNSEAFRTYLSAQARFHHYSWGNVLLILAQKPDAIKVAGYQTWKSLDRQVKKGERAIRILAPAYYKKKEQDPHPPLQELAGHPTGA